MNLIPVLFFVIQKKLKQSTKGHSSIIRLKIYFILNIFINCEELASNLYNMAIIFETLDIMKSKIGHYPNNLYQLFKSTFMVSM